jgi:hypothetical protein
MQRHLPIYPVQIPTLGPFRPPNTTRMHLGRGKFRGKRAEMGSKWAGSDDPRESEKARKTGPFQMVAGAGFEPVTSTTWPLVQLPKSC